MVLRRQIFLTLVLFVLAPSISLAMMNIQINVEQNHAKLEFRSSALEVLGFLMQPKSKKQKKQLLELNQYFERKIKKIFVLEPHLACEITKDRIGLNTDEYDKATKIDPDKKIKGDYVAVFNIECLQDLMGSKVVINLRQQHVIRKISINLQIGDSIQKSFTSKNKIIKLDLQ